MYSVLPGRHRLLAAVAPKAHRMVVDTEQVLSHLYPAVWNAFSKQVAAPAEDWRIETKPNEGLGKRVKRKVRGIFKLIWDQKTGNHKFRQARITRLFNRSGSVLELLAMNPRA